MDGLLQAFITRVGARNPRQVRSKNRACFIHMFGSEPADWRLHLLRGAELLPKVEEPCQKHTCQMATPGELQGLLETRGDERPRFLSLSRAVRCFSLLRQLPLGGAFTADKRLLRAGLIAPKHGARYRRAI